MLIEDFKNFKKLVTIVGNKYLINAITAKRINFYYQASMLPYYNFMQGALFYSF